MGLEVEDAERPDIHRRTGLMNEAYDRLSQTLFDLLELLDRLERHSDDQGIKEMSWERFEILERNPDLELEEINVH
jgi:hypothetical protein